MPDEGASFSMFFPHQPHPKGTSFGRLRRQLLPGEKPYALLRLTALGAGGWAGKAAPYV